MSIFSYPSILTYVLGAQKNRLIETVLLSTHNLCFGLEIRKFNFCYALLTKVLSILLFFLELNIANGSDLLQPRSYFELSGSSYLESVIHV